MADPVIVETRNEDETRAFGARIGAAVQAGDVILLKGPFGAGKTTFVQGLARGLGVSDQVTSPSFVIACEYQGRIPLYHVDLYRLDEMDETTLEALAEYFGGDGVCAVEWPDTVPSDLIQGAAQIALSADAEDVRLLALEDGPARLWEVFQEAGAPAQGAHRESSAGHRNTSRN